MFFDDHTIESEYIQIECFLTANIIQSGCIQIECSFIHCISNLFFNHYSMSVNTPRAAGYSESDDDSSEDGCVGEILDDVVVMNPLTVMKTMMPIPKTVCRAPPRSILPETPSFVVIMILPF